MVRTSAELARAEALRCKTEGNEAYGSGRMSDAITAYTKGIEALQDDGENRMDKGDLLSNRSAALLAMADYDRAAADASAAASIFLAGAPGSAFAKKPSAKATAGPDEIRMISPECRKKAAKAFARLGAASEASGKRLAAVQAYRRGYELEGTTERCEALAEAIACIFSSVRCVTGRRQALRPGESWRQGDLAADIEPGGYELLLDLARQEGPRWELVRMAAIVSLAGLAACPAHREAFLRPGGGVSALAAAASSVDHHRLPLPPRLADAWRRRCGASYEGSSLLLPAAVGLSNLTKHRACVPQLEIGALLLSYRPVHVAAAHLVTRTANCNASQEAVGAIYQALVTALKDAGQVEQFVSLGGPEALEALRAREELEGRTSFKIAVTGMLETVRRHPMHPSRRCAHHDGDDAEVKGGGGRE